MNFFRKLSVLAFALMLIFSSFSLYAEEDEDWYMDKPVTQVNFEGLKTIKRAELSGLTSSYIGKTVEECVYDIIDRLYALELFDDIIPVASHDKGDGVVLTFTVVEKPQVLSVNFKGNHQVRNAPLREAISIKPNEIFTESKATALVEFMKKLLLKKAFQMSKFLILQK